MIRLYKTFVIRLVKDLQTGAGTDDGKLVFLTYDGRWSENQDEAMRLTPERELLDKYGVNIPPTEGTIQIKEIFLTPVGE